MILQVLLLGLTAAGAIQALYLLRKKMTKKIPVCIIGEECGKVLESKYNKLLGIPNEVLGLIFYIVAALLVVLQWKTLLDITIFAGGFFSLILIYLQWRIIKAWCFWCLMSAITVFLMVVVDFLIMKRS